MLPAWSLAGPETTVKLQGGCECLFHLRLDFCVLGNSSMPYLRKRREKNATQSYECGTAHRHERWNFNCCNSLQLDLRALCSDF